MEIITKEGKNKNDCDAFQKASQSFKKTITIIFEKLRIHLCSATYLTNFYLLGSCLSLWNDIFDSNLKLCFKYEKHTSKSGKNRREL